MSREKQIFGVESITELPCWQGAKQCWCEVSCNDCIESHLLAAGYRKQSDVAREIFEELDGRLDKICIVANNKTDYNSFIGVVQQVFDAVGVVLDELKKKYTEEHT